MRTRIVELHQAAAARGTVVVIDVLRAFTTAAWAIGRGAREIVLVSTVAEALAERDAAPGTLAMGEVDGVPVEGFDLSNSPTEVALRDLTGRRIVHRSSAGTQGVVRASGADRVIAASFVVAGATARLLAAAAPEEVTFLVTGAHSGRDGDEDRALADYLIRVLAGDRPDPAPYLARVVASDYGRCFGMEAHLPAADLEMACQLDRFDLTLPVERTDGRSVLRPHAPRPAVGL